MATTGPEFMARVLQSLGGIIYVYDLEEQRNLYVSPRWGEEFGYSTSETQVSSGKLLPRIIHPDDLDAVTAHHGRLRTAADNGTQLLEYRVRRKDGSYAWVLSVDRPMDRDGQGLVKTIAGHVHEITVQKAAEAAEAEGRARFKAIVQHLPDAVVISDSEANVLDVNDAACNQLGYSREQLRQMKVTECVTPRHREHAPEHQPPPTGAAATLQRAHLRSDGSEVPVETVVVGIELDGQPAFLGVARDISDRLRLEAQLRDAQRMEAIGRLAGAVAHDFNNILAAILGSAELLRHESDLPSGAGRLAGEITAAASRGSELTRQLLTFGRRQPTDKRPVEVASTLERTLSVLRRLVEPGTTIRTRAQPNLMITADPSMFDQVIMNLVLNARDAMPDGGTVEVAASLSETQAGMVEITVADNGDGIAPEDLPRVFEPFFTTKEDERGTGIGLATVYGIVAQHDARIRVDSKKGEGTRFHMLWPQAAGAEGTFTEPGEKAAAFRANNGLTVLLVEDIDAVRAVVEQLLLAAGHRVLAASGVSPARELFAEHRDDIDLVVSDVALGEPHGGPELALELQESKPGLPIILMSGLAQDAERMRPLERVEFLPKPFTLRQLETLIARLRDAS